MAMKRADVIPAVLLVAGGYLAWFGVHYWRSDVKYPTDPVKAVLTGKPLPDNTRNDASEISGAIGSLASGLSGVAGAAGEIAAGSGQAIATDALKYSGAGYVFGGNASKVGDWDCSSFVSYVLGHDLGYVLPGGNWGNAGFPPHSHGPTTLNYMLWGTSVELKDVQAGDLIVSTEHIGIAISPTQMISAQDEQLGTGTSGFPGGFPAGPPVYRRVIEFSPQNIAGAAGQAASGITAI